MAGTGAGHDDWGDRRRRLGGVVKAIGVAS
jgi:hypothetical protein